MHTSMTENVMRAPLSFFHTNPTGRILNRLSKDQGITDDYLPTVLFDALQSLCAVLGAYQSSVACLGGSMLHVLHLKLSAPPVKFVFDMHWMQ